MWHFVLCLLGVANAFYLPGMKPVDYGLGDTVNLKVNKVSSVHTQVPYDFYHFAYCKPLGGVKQASENLGEFLSGDRIDNSAYDIQILNSVGCKVVCMKQFTAKNVNDFKHAVHSLIHSDVPRLGP